MKSTHVILPRLRQFQYGFVLSAIAFAVYPLPLCEIAEIEAKLELANLAFARKEKLLAKGMTAQAEFDTARAVKLELEANLEAAKAALVLAEDDLRHTRIVSPTDGKIGLTAKTAGNYVTPESGVLATIVKTDPLRVRFSLSMADYARLFGCSEERLKSGETVIVGGTHKVSDGAAVTCKSETTSH